jgi:uncharacterized protein YjbI with pentapeptide repeats
VSDSLSDERIALENLNPEELLAHAVGAEEQLQRLQAQVEAAERRNEAVIQGTTRLFVWGFAGPQLYEAVRQVWNDLDQWLQQRLEGPWPKAATRDLIAAVVHRMTRIGLFAVALALLPTIFLLIQSMLLNTQNEKFTQQNNLLGFQVTANFRQAFFQAPFDEKFNRIDDYVRALTAEQDGRNDAAPAIHRWPRPNDSVVAQVANLAQTEAETTVASLMPLLSDDAVTVAASTLMVFQKLEGVVIRDIPLILTRADISSADLSGLDIQGLEISESFVVGSTFEGSKLPEADFSTADAGATNFNDTDLNAAVFRGAQLHHARFSGANLNGADFSQAIMQDADLSGAVAEGAQFAQSCLVNSIWMGANVARANFDGTDLQGAHLIAMTGWESASYTGANIYRVVNAPDGFVAHAFASGAHCVRNNYTGALNEQECLEVAETERSILPVDSSCPSVDPK